MKKIISIIISLILILSSSVLFACKPKNSNVIRLSEVTHSTFYAPLYVSINKGYFEEQGLTVKLSSGEGADKVIAGITSKSIDIGLCGPEAVIYCANNGIKDVPMIFGQLTKRDGSFLVSKTNEKPFDWNNLKNKRLLAGRVGGVPAMTLEYVLNSKGIKTDELNFDTSVSFANMAGVFQADETVQYTTLFEPTASEMVSSGKGYILASIGQESGEVPYTAFVANKTYIKTNRETVKKFLTALMKGYNFMVSNDSYEVAKALAPSFSGYSIESLKATIDSYLSIDAWSSTPVLSESALTKLQDIMENAGELSKRVDFLTVVDNSIALELSTK